MEITHLVTNGCSFTYCQGLWDPPNEGWPRLLANMLKVPVVNLAVPGSSNDGIHRRTYNYFYKNLPIGSKPLFVIAMSMSIRTEGYLSTYLSEKVQDYMNLAATDPHPLSKAIYTEMDDMGICLSEERKLRHWASLINLFETNDIPFLMSDYMPDPTGISENFVKNECIDISRFIKTHPNVVRNFCDITLGHPKALDGSHDGKEAQQVLAEYIYRQLLKRYRKITPVKSNYLTLANFPTLPKYKFEQTNQWYLHEIGKEYNYGID
jgi:hypothetical protein